MARNKNDSLKAVGTNLDKIVYKLLEYKCEEESITVAEALREAIYEYVGLNAGPLEVAKLMSRVEALEDTVAEQEEALLKGPDGKFLPLVQINTKEKELIE